MTAPYPGSPSSRRADMPVAEGELDADLARLVRRTSVVRQGFYVVVLLVALAGQVSGAVETLHIPLAAAIPAVSALELGGIVVLANADVRRRLGERAIASRLLSVAIAAAAVTFNWLAHADHLLGGFFAGMSALGYLVWLMHTENQRRDRLRIKGDLPPTTPAYEIGGHWLRHPWLTMRARALAKADPRLGLYDSLASARADIRRERRQAAIAKVLHRKIRSAVDPRTADIAIAVYDLDEIAARLADRADYDGLTSLIAADLAPERLAPDGVLTDRASGRRKGSQHAVRAEVVPPIAAPPAAAAIPFAADPPTNGRRAVPSQAGPAEPTRRRRQATPPVADIFVEPVDIVRSGLPEQRPDAETPAASGAPSTLFTELRRDLSHLQPVRGQTWPLTEDATDMVSAPGGEVSLRRRVHDALDANVLPGDQRDDTELVSLVFDELGLSDLERLSAQSYVRSWLLETRTGERVRSA
jgi:hypothetical protein